MKAKVALIYAALLILLSTAVVSAAPNAPDGVVASNGRHTDRIEVNWDPVPNAQFYSIYRSSEDNPDLRVILGAWQAGTRFVNHAAEHGRRYFYWIGGGALSHLCRYARGGIDAGRFSSGRSGSAGHNSRHCALARKL